MGERDLVVDARSAPGAEQQSAETGQENVLALVHRRLRGRYRYAIALGALLAIPFAYTGYTLKKPEFRSSGIVRIAPSIDYVIAPTPETGELPAFESFVAAQASFIKSRKVLDTAVDDPNMRKVEWPAGNQGVKDLQGALSVGRKRGEQLIEVSVAHVDRKFAQTAVNAVLDAYDKHFGNNSDQSNQNKKAILQQRERDLMARISTIRDQMTALTDEYGPDMLPRVHAEKVDELTTLEKQLADLIAQIEQAESRGGTPVEQGHPEAIDMALIERDPQLQQMHANLNALRARKEAYARHYMQNHLQMKHLAREIDQVQVSIRLREQELMATAERGELNPKVSTIGMTLAQMKTLRDQMKTREATLREATQALLRKQQETSKLREELLQAQEQLREARERLDQLSVETGTDRAGRISIVQRGDVPIEPEDKRKMFAAAGALFGGGLGFGIIFLLGLLDRGYRYIDDLEHDTLSAPLLGTLPDLTSRSIEHDEMAALSVHHLRNMLQLQVPGGGAGCRVYAITSATAGDGKTSLALALGMSFAVSGQRTLLLDADLVGRGLTRELKLDGRPGLCQVIGAEKVNGQLHDSTVPNLWTLPAGVPDIDAKHLSHGSMEKLMRSLRGQFDVILVDSGPLLGSLEANLVATLSDGVVLTVSRGQSHKFVEACLERLRRMNAHCAGLVFNRAEARDFERSISAASVCSQSLRPPTSPTGPADVQRSARGALVRAVMGPAGGSAPVEERAGAKP